MARYEKPKGRGCWIALLILLILFNLAALLIGKLMHFAAGVSEQVAVYTSGSDSVDEEITTDLTTAETTETALTELTGEATVPMTDSTGTGEQTGETVTAVFGSAESTDNAAAAVTTQQSDAQQPATQQPVNQQPATQPPANQQPATQPPANQSSGIPADSGGNPKPEDFRWLGTTPAGVTDQEYYEGLGKWKGMLIYDESTKDMVNVLIDVMQSGDITVTIDWYQLVINGEPPVDETGDPDTVYTGRQSGSGIVADGTGQIEIVHFYTDGVNQYATGSLTANGRAYALALVRRCE